MRYFRSPRTPFQIAERRSVIAPLLAAHVTPGHRAGLCTLQPPLRLTIRDIEDESVLISSGAEWYRVHLDEFVNATRGVVSLFQLKLGCARA